MQIITLEKKGVLEIIKRMSKNTLWTKDFKIITIGSFISLIGNQLSGFAMSLLVLDYTSSSLLYAVYVLSFTIPQVLLPIFAGSFLDRFSRKRMIYTLDFISCGIYLGSGILLSLGFFNFIFFLILNVLLGSIQTVYQVAYSSFYPLLVEDKSNLNKAYSVQSFMDSMIAFAVPLSAVLYNAIGLGNLLLINSACFLIAAIFETRIKTKEEYAEKNKIKEKSKVKQFFLDTKEGFLYLKGEKGLFCLALYFFASSITMGFQNVCFLPYVKNHFENGALLYSLLTLIMFAGRGIGSVLNYKIKFPKEKKYYITVIVYFIAASISALCLFFPYPIMCALFFLSGLLGVTSYTLRISATQSYVPDEKKGRFNGAFSMLSTIGMLIGEMTSGALGEFIEAPYLFLGVGIVELLFCFFFVALKGKYIKKLYLY